MPNQLDSGRIVIKFNTVTDNATIRGIEVRTGQCRQKSSSNQRSTVLGPMLQDA
jgi:hypothetical protein